jgi:carbonic anhydrase
MRLLEELFEHNRRWSRAMTASDPEFFRRLSLQQAPRYLWIGCSDSRVPANQIVGLLPGELFVHRNVANLVVHTDLNCLSVLQYAVDVLKVEHVIVCGHFGCGGVRAAAQSLRFGLIDNWLRHVQDVRDRHAALLASIDDEAVREDRLCALNVVEQARNVAETTIALDAWARGQRLAIHGWVYGIGDGLLRDLDTTIDGPGVAASRYADALRALGAEALRAPVAGA